MDRQALHEGHARLVHPGEMDVSAPGPQLQNHPVDGSHRGRIPDVGMREVDLDLRNDFSEVKGLDEPLDRDEEQLAAHYIDPTTIQRDGALDRD